MDLLLPEVGTLIWMLIAVGIVFFILIKWGFPMITDSVDKRKSYIDASLEKAEQANNRLEGIKQECSELLEQAKKERAEILQETAKLRQDILQKAQQESKEEGEKIIAQARTQIEQEREEAIRSIRAEVAALSVAVAQKLVQKELDDSSEQQELTNKLIDQIQK